MADAVISVRQLNAYIRSVMDGDTHLAGIYVVGEISNCKLHYQSGHLYFTLKDNDASVKAVMFRSAAGCLKFRPEDGMRVVCFGRVSVYEAAGQYQLYVTAMEPDGIGSLAVAFEQLKEKLQKEGLFDSAKKRPLPAFPLSVSVVTSGTGAALKDILSILERRAPYIKVNVYPVQVQGDTAPLDMCRALNVIYSKNDTDLIIIGRGGGSAEDLCAFNDETLARKIAVSPIPVISAVGHETDFTICDFVADLRAPTPSAAAELAAADKADLALRINNYKALIVGGFKNRIAVCEKDYADVFLNRCFQNPDTVFAVYHDNLTKVKDKINSGFRNYVKLRCSEFSEAVAKLNALSPLAVLARGYAVVKKDNSIVDSASKLTVGDDVNIQLSDGIAKCRVTDTEAFKPEPA